MDPWTRTESSDTKKTGADARKGSIVHRSAEVSAEGRRDWSEGGRWKGGGDGGRGDAYGGAASIYCPHSAMLGPDVEA